MTQVVIFSDASVSFNIPIKSSGPYRVASELRNLGLQCQVISLLFHFTEDEIYKLATKFIDNDTKIVGISSNFWFHLNDIQLRKIKILEERTRAIGAKFILGGNMSYLFADKLYFDACFETYSEYKLTLYVDAILKQKDIPTPNRISNVGTPTYISNSKDWDFNSSKINYVKEDCLNYGESVVIEISRGCIFKCDFCLFPLNGKKKLDYIKHENTLKEELIENYEKYGIQYYTFSDDTINDSTYKLEYLHRVISNLPFEFKFTGYIRLDLLYAHKEQIKLFKEMGLTGTFFGVESFNYEAAKKIGKGMKPEKIKQFLYDLKKTYWGDNININVGLISGLPGETLASQKETIDYILDEQNCLLDRIHSSALNIPNPLLNNFAEKSLFEINASKHGFYWPNNKSHDWKNYNYEIKSSEQARHLSEEIVNAATRTHRIWKSNFGLMITYNMAHFADEPKTFDELQNMPRKMYTDWFVKNIKVMSAKYIDNYKNKIFGL